MIEPCKTDRSRIADEPTYEPCTTEGDPRFNQDGSFNADYKPSSSIGDTKHLTTQGWPTFKIRTANCEPTEVAFRRVDGTSIATIKDGIFRVHVDPTDENAKQFIEIVNNFLRMYGQPELKEVQNEHAHKTRSST